MRGPTTTPARTGLLVLLAALGMLALTGCGTSSTDADADTAQQPVVDAPPGKTDSAAVGVAEPGTSSTTTVDQTRAVVRSGFVVVNVEDVLRSALAIHSLVAQRHGLVTAEDTSTQRDGTSSSLTVQVPATDLDAFIADVRALGKVESVSLSAQDVTSQVVDLDARIKALQASVDRMAVLLAKAERIDDLLAIETQMSSRQAELDSLQAQRKYLGEQVAMASVSVSLTPVGAPVPVDAPGFASGLRNGWAALVSAVALLLTAAGLVFPFAVVAALLAGPIALIARRRSRRSLASG